MIRAPAGRWRSLLPVVLLLVGSIGWLAACVAVDRPGKAAGDKPDGANRPVGAIWSVGANRPVGAKELIGPIKPIAAADLKSGLAFSSAELREQQADAILNPGMLAVDQGSRAWRQAPASGQPSCLSCHGDAAQSMRGLAARLPKPSADGKRLENLHTLVNRCRAERQRQPALEYESPPLLGLVSYLAHQSRGLPIKVDVQGAAQPFFEHGQRLYTQRIGQMNLACSHCHDQNWGRRLLNEPISQGHGNAYPIYRLEWQAMGSLHRRFRSCQFGVRAQLQPQGNDDFMALELYLAWRAEGLKVETPGVRR